MQRRNKEHLELWELDFERQQQKYEERQAERDAVTDKVTSELRETIDNLKEEIHSKPVQIVERNLDQEKVDEAIRERDNSEAARLRTYRTLAKLRVIHHDTGRGLCKCGIAIAKCEETEILNSDRSFLYWEVRQVDRINRYGQYSSALPESHPAVINPRWSPPGKTVSEARR